MGVSREKLVAFIRSEDDAGTIDWHCMSTAFINKLHLWIDVQIKRAVERALRDSAIDKE